MLEYSIYGLSGFLLGGLTVWLYFRNKFIEVLTELEDKKLIIKTIHDHADELERANVKKMAKEHNAKVAKKSKSPKKDDKTTISKNKTVTKRNNKTKKV